VKYVNILSKPYEILEAKDTQVASSIMGSCNRTMQKIVLITDIGIDQVADTLIHEVVHIISHELGIGLKEVDVMRLAVGLYSAGVRIPVVEVDSESTNSANSE